MHIIPVFQAQLQNRYMYNTLGFISMECFFRILFINMHFNLIFFMSTRTTKENSLNFQE